MLRINAELGSTETGAQLWSAGFNQKIDDLAEGQDQIVIRMRSALNVSLADIEAARSLQEHPTNPDAFDLILRARAVVLQPITKGTLTQAMSLYELALQRDPDSVLALCGAAMTLLNGHVLRNCAVRCRDRRAHINTSSARKDSNPTPSRCWLRKPIYWIGSKTGGTTDEFGTSWKLSPSD